MSIPYLLIDYENVKRLNPALLACGEFHVILFLGPQDTKLPVNLVLAMDHLGARGQYVVLQTSGPNALDFLLSHHLGTLTARDPQAFFFILSRDTGFDPLMAHLRGQGCHCARVTTLEEIPRPPTEGAPVRPLPPHDHSAPATAGEEPAPATATNAAPAAADALVTRAVALLHKFPHNKPASVTTLHSTLRPLCGPQAPPEQVTALVTALAARGYVHLNGEAVAYTLPPPPASALGTLEVAAPPDLVSRAVHFLHKFPHCKPASVTALHNHLRALCFPQAPTEQVRGLITALAARGWVRISGEAVTYALPAAA